MDKFFRFHTLDTIIYVKSQYEDIIGPHMISILKAKNYHHDVYAVKYTRTFARVSVCYNSNYYELMIPNGDDLY